MNTCHKHADAHGSQNGALDPLELKLSAGVSGCYNLDWDPLEEQQGLVAADASLQSLSACLLTAAALCLSLTVPSRDTAKHIVGIQ